MLALAIAPAVAATAPPPGMVLVPAGTFVRGRARTADGPEVRARPDESPPHRVRLRAFYLDATLVTRADYARFAARTGYRTLAERRGYGIGSTEGMNDWEWERIPRASFRRPFRDQTPDAEAFLRDDAPAVMISYEDAARYCAELGRRLPTEAEWEYAMRAGRSGTRYPWGDRPDGPDGPDAGPRRLRLNFWQGESHRRNLRQDGYVYVSPVRAFPPNDWGIYDPVGNVWQWTSDWYAPDTYAAAATAARAQPDREARSAAVIDREARSAAVIDRAQDRAIDASAGPAQPGTPPRRVVRGGSWWCGACTCEGNGLFYRGKSAPDATFNNVGFRCAMDLPEAR